MPDDNSYQDIEDYKFVGIKADDAIKQMLEVAKREGLEWEVICQFANHLFHCKTSDEDVAIAQCCREALYEWDI
jgi:hypothetical protein